MSLRDAWEQAAPEWIAWARAPGHDSYWRFHREAFFSLVPAPGELTLDIGCGEGRVARDLATLGHRVVGLDGAMAWLAPPPIIRAPTVRWLSRTPHGCRFVMAAATWPSRS